MHQIGEFLEKKHKIISLCIASPYLYVSKMYRITDTLLILPYWKENEAARRNQMHIICSPQYGILLTSNYIQYTLWHNVNLLVFVYKRAAKTTSLFMRAAQRVYNWPPAKPSNNNLCYNLTMYPTHHNVSNWRRNIL